MNSSVQVSSHPQLRKLLQNRLFFFAASFLFLYCVSLSLAPLAKNHSWSGEIIWKPWIGFIVWFICYFITQRLADSWLKKHDPYILPIMFFLIGWGNLAIWRLSLSLGLRQTIWLIIGTIVLLAVIRYPGLLNILARYRYLWLVISFILIGFTLLPGVINPGSQPNLWLSIGPFNLQPSEPLKLFLIVYLAAYFSDRLAVKPRSWAILLPSMVVICITTMLLVMQKDLGTASLILMLYTFAIYTITRQKRVLLVAILVLLIASIVGFFTIDVIRLRIEAWINPWLDPTARSYQIVQSLIALASGRFLGSGPGMGAPSLVPVAVSDFIFTAIVEETGLLGGAGLVTLIYLLFSRSIQTAQKAENPFAALLAGGLGMLLAFQSILIIGGNIRLIPLTGVTLPFVSYGGSSLLVSMVAIGLILRISNQSPKSILVIPIFDSLRSRVLVLVTTGFIAVLLLLPVWSIIRSDSLIQRGDNLRLSFNDLYVKRGAILDRNDQPINSTTGSTGTYQRVYHYPDLSATVGYAQPLYGLAGIESSLDPTLRGSTGYPAIQLWWNNLLTSQTPPGLDIRLSLDLNIQKVVDTALHGSSGAAVILNASSGEILAMSSQPGFDPSILDTTWDTLINDPKTPLLNRVVNGQYPIGTTTAVFLYAQSIENNLHLAEFTTNTVSFEGKKTTCAINLGLEQVAIQDMLRYSCPQISLVTARSLGKLSLYQTYSRFGWYQVPSLPLPENQVSDPGEITNIKTSAVGQEHLAISPLQMALTTASISAGGTRPTQKLVMSYQNPEGKWNLLATNDSNRQVFSKSTVLEIQQLTQIDDLPAWGVVGKGLSGSDKWVTWFIGGTSQDWNGSPLTVVFVLEEDNPQKAFDLGRNTLTQLIIQ